MAVHKVTVGEWNPNFEMDSATRTIWYDQDPNWKPACFKCGSTKNQKRLSSQLYYCAGEQHWVEPDDQVLSAPILGSTIAMDNHWPNNPAKRRTEWPTQPPS